MTIQAMQPNHSTLAPSRAPKVSLLGILFFLLGAPHLYSFLQRRSTSPQPFKAFPLAALMLLACGAFYLW